MLFHIILLNMLICSTLMDNTSSQINIFYNIKRHGMLELKVLTGNYISWFCRRYAATSTVSSDTSIKPRKIIIGVHPHVTCRFI